MQNGTHTEIVDEAGVGEGAKVEQHALEEVCIFFIWQ